MYIMSAYITEGKDNDSWFIIQPILSLFDSWSKILHSKSWGEDLFHVYCLFPVVVIYTYLTYLILHSQLKVSHTNIQISPFSLYLSLTFSIISFVFHSSLVCFNKYIISFICVYFYIFYWYGFIILIEPYDMKRKFEHRVKFSMCVRVASSLDSKHSFTGEFKSPRNFHPISYFPLSVHPNPFPPTLCYIHLWSLRACDVTDLSWWP